MTTLNNIINMKCTEKYGFIYLLDNEERNYKDKPVFKSGCVEAVDRTINYRLNEHNSRKKSTDTICPWEPIIIWEIEQPVKETEQWLFEMIEPREDIERRYWPSGKPSEQFIGKTTDINVVDIFRLAMKYKKKIYDRDGIEDKSENIQISRVDTPTKSRKRTIDDMSERKEPKKRRKSKTKKDRLYKYLHPSPSQSTSIRFGSLRRAKQAIYDMFTDFGVKLSLSENYKDYSEEWSFVLPDDTTGIGIKKLLLYLPYLLVKKSFGSKQFMETTIGKFHFDSTMGCVKMLRNYYTYNSGKKFTKRHFNEVKTIVNAILSLNSDLSLIHQNNWANIYDWSTFRWGQTVSKIEKTN